MDGSFFDRYGPWAFVAVRPPDLGPCSPTRPRAVWDQRDPLRSPE